MTFKKKLEKDSRFSFKGFKLSLFVTTLLLGLGFSQYQTLVFTIPGNFKYFTMDQNGTLYTINKDHVIQKWNQKGQKLHSVNNKALGEINFLDVTNPLRVYLYYPDANIGIITDNTLSETNRIDWDKLGYDQAVLSCRSTESGFWLFDGNDMKLKRINSRGEVLAESNNLYAYTDQSINPNALIEYGNRIFLNLPAQGIIMFDRYATYIKTIPVQNVRTFDPKRNVLFYWSSDSLSYYNLKRNQTERLNLPDTTLEAIQKVRVRNDQFLIQTQNQIEIYQKN